MSHNDIAHKCIGYNCTDHDRTGHNDTGYNYTGQNCTGHNYTGHDLAGLRQRERRRHAGVGEIDVGEDGEAAGVGRDEDVKELVERHRAEVVAVKNSET